MHRKIQCFCLLILCYFFTFSLNVQADVCSDETYLRLKQEVKNIEVHYEFLDLDDDSITSEEIRLHGYNYMITVSGMGEDIYFISPGNINNKFNYSDSKDGVVTYYVENTDGDLVLKFYSTECYFSVPLRSINLELPVLNDYYYTDECEAIREKGINIPICQKTISKEEKNKNQNFFDIVEQYLIEEEDNPSFWERVSYLFQKPYFIILVITLGLFVLGIIGYLIYRFMKRRRLE